MIERPVYLQKLIQFKDTDFIKVITGVRRCGKSVLLELYRDYLLGTGVEAPQVIYINFESYEYQRIITEQQFYDLMKEKLADKRRYYILLDEIQMVNNWQRVVNGIRVSYDCDIVITGSNAKMLSGELATLISGRYVEIPVYPLSFKEYLSAKGIAGDSRKVDIAFNEYKNHGGFPSVVIADESIKDTILSGIFDTIVLNDVTFRSGIKEPAALKAVTRFLADNVGQLVNPTSIANVLKQGGIHTNPNTVNRYLGLLEEGYLFYRARQYDIRGKAYLQTSGKYFAADPGLRNHAVDYRPGNYGHHLENIVYLELLRRGYTVDVGKLDAKEIDFVARKQGDIQYIQVAYALPESARETDNLLHIRDNYKKTVITERYADVGEIEGIPIVYIVDWLLADES